METQFTSKDKNKIRKSIRKKYKKAGRNERAVQCRERISWQCSERLAL
jgi:hypothetical protein